MYPIAEIIDQSEKFDPEAAAEAFDPEGTPPILVSAFEALNEGEWRVTALHIVPPDADADADEFDELFVDVAPLDPKNGQSFTIPPDHVLIAECDETGALVRIKIAPATGNEQAIEDARNASLAASIGFRRALFARGRRGSLTARATSVLEEWSEHHRALPVAARITHARAAVRGVGLRVAGPHRPTPLDLALGRTAQFSDAAPEEPKPLAWSDDVAGMAPAELATLIKQQGGAALWTKATAIARHVPGIKEATNDERTLATAALLYRAGLFNAKDLIDHLMWQGSQDLLPMGWITIRKAIEAAEGAEVWEQAAAWLATIVSDWEALNDLDRARVVGVALVVSDLFQVEDVVRRTDSFQIGERLADEQTQEQTTMTATDQTLRNLILAQPGSNHVQQTRSLLLREASFVAADEVTQHRLVMSVLASAGFQASEQHVARKALESARYQLALSEERSRRTARTPTPAPGAVDIGMYPGRNDTERAMACCRATMPGAAQLSYDELFEIACNGKNSGKFVNLSAHREAAR